MLRNWFTGGIWCTKYIHFSTNLSQEIIKLVDWVKKKRWLPIWLMLDGCATLKALERHLAQKRSISLMSGWSSSLCRVAADFNRSKWVKGVASFWRHPSRSLYCGKSQQLHNNTNWIVCQVQAAALEQSKMSSKICKLLSNFGSWLIVVLARTYKIRLGSPRYWPCTGGRTGPTRASQIWLVERVATGWSSETGQASDQPTSSCS